MGFQADLLAALTTTSGTFNSVSVQNIDFGDFVAALSAMASRADAIDGGALNHLASTWKMLDRNADGGDDFWFAAEGNVWFVQADTDNDGVPDITCLQLDAANSQGLLFGSELLTVGNAPAKLVSNLVHLVYADAKLYGSATDIHLSDLDVTITPATATQKVRLDVSATIEGSGNGAIYLKRNGVEVGSAAAAGNRMHGLAPVPHDVDNNSTPSPLALTVLDDPQTTSPVTYSWHVRMGTASAVALNRSLTDTDASNFERGTSTVIAMGVTT